MTSQLGSAEGEMQIYTELMALPAVLLFLVQVVHISICSAGRDLPILSTCLPHRPCSLALASQNQITLSCGRTPRKGPVSWQYLDMGNPNARHVLLVQSDGLLSHKQPRLLELVSNDLKILSPRVEDSGVYVCKDGDEFVAYYEIDFQDAQDISISHASLGQSEQPNATFMRGEKGSLHVFTVWTAWQPCDRCGIPGERKRVGFCYGKLSNNSGAEVMPCGFLRFKMGAIPLPPRMELRVEMCNTSCESTAPPGGEIPLLIDNYHTYLYTNAVLVCPSANIYQPVYWQRGNLSITRLQQLLHRLPFALDSVTGGGSMSVPVLTPSDTGTYECYVGRVLAGRFHVILPEVHYTGGKHAFTPIESAIIGFSIFVIFLLLLSIVSTCKKPVWIAFR